MSTLATIMSKVRKVTGRISVDQLSDAELEEFINMFVHYELPSHLRLFYNRVPFTFQLTPRQPVYPIAAIKNDYMTFEQPCYIDGIQVQYYQDEQNFYQIFPRIKYSTLVGNGNNTTGPYNFNYSYTPVDPTTMVISAVNGAGVSLVAKDNGIGGLIVGQMPITGITQAANAVVTVPGVSVVIGDFIYLEGVNGMTQINGGPYQVTAVAGNNVTLNVNSLGMSAYTNSGFFSIQSGTINYLTGVISNVIFPSVIPMGNNIFASANSYVVGRPFAVLYSNNSFRFWPYPDRAYTFMMMSYKNPLQMIYANQEPELNLWTEMIVYGVSGKIFSESMDMESYAKVFPVFDMYRRLSERRTLKQLSTQRTSTIYNDGVSWPSQFYGYPYN